MFFHGKDKFAIGDADKEKKRVRFILTNTTGNPRTWARTKFDEYEATGGAWPSWGNFKTEFLSAFAKVDSAMDAMVNLTISEARTSGQSMTSMSRSTNTFALPEYLLQTRPLS